tara:strand:+ start:7570 stop:8055 length:486 start_codon:yes stop_codon:yes gene_type:complete
MNEYRLGKRSLEELRGVHPDLIGVVKAAIKITEQDFSIHDGIRTPVEQNSLYRRGASQIDGYRKIGKHQPQADGFGHAVDLVPYVGGRMRWEWPPIYEIAKAVQTAARTHGVKIRWGGCWEEISQKRDGDPEAWVQAYVQRKLAAGKKAFNDGPHYELYGY